MNQTPDYIKRQARAIAAQKELGAQSQGTTEQVDIAGLTRVYQNARYLEFNFNVDNTSDPVVDFVLAQDVWRNYLIIQNNSANIMYVTFTGQTGNFTVGIQIAASQCWEPNIAPTSGFSIAGNGAGVVITGSAK